MNYDGKGSAFLLFYKIKKGLYDFILSIAYLALSY